MSVGSGLRPRVPFHVTTSQPRSKKGAGLGPVSPPNGSRHRVRYTARKLGAPPKTHARAPHIGIDLLAVPRGPLATPVRFPVLEQVTAEQIENLLEQVGIAMNGLDPEQHGRDIIAGPGIEYEVINVDLAQNKDLVFGNSHGVSLPKIVANQRDRSQTPRRDSILGLAKLTELSAQQALNPFWRGH